MPAPRHRQLRPPLLIQPARQETPGPPGCKVIIADQNCISETASTSPSPSDPPKLERRARHRPAHLPQALPAPTSPLRPQTPGAGRIAPVFRHLPTWSSTSAAAGFVGYAACSSAAMPRPAGCVILPPTRAENRTTTGRWKHCATGADGAPAAACFAASSATRATL